MAACLGSICNVPVTSVVLLLELAGGKDYGVVLPTVAATGEMQNPVNLGWLKCTNQLVDYQLIYLLRALKQFCPSTAN